MSDAVDDHIEHIRELSRRDGPLTESSPHSTMENPRWFVAGGIPKPARRRLHTELIAEVCGRFPETQTNCHAVILAGPPGAGKSRTIADVLGNEKASYLVVNADDFKELLLERAVDDGTYEEFLKPQEVRDLEAQGEQFFPLELAALVHRESSFIAGRLRNLAMAEGLNIIIDGVLVNRSKALALGRQLEPAVMNSPS